MARKALGAVLVEKGYITDEQLKNALESQKLAENSGKRIGALLIELGYLTSEQLLAGMASRFGYNTIDLRDFKIDEAAFKMVPKQIALKYSVAAVGFNQDSLIIAVSDPSNLLAIEDIKSVIRVNADFRVSDKKSIDKILGDFYSEESVQDAANKAEGSIEVDASGAADDTDNSAPVIALVNSILLKGYTAGASDIHIEPFENNTYVRLRIDGQLIDYINIASQLHSAIVTRIKVMSDLNIAEKRIPQDGHFKVTLENKLMNIRVSTLPMLYGEKVVMRFLNSDTALDYNETFGMNQYNYEKISRIMKNPNGVIYITGPTGSGKTTTLYMMIDKIAQGTINVSTIEDPVERPLRRINQTQVNVQAGMTFAIGLRALLRQDPDVILVGETRDGETASIGVTAAITGHLVFSTLHTNDAISTITRLEDMGVEYYLLASAIKGIVAQRLMKKICPKCKQEYTPTTEEKLILGEGVDKVYRGKGCDHCNGTGYKGRIAVHEVLEVDEIIRQLIAKKAPIKEIYDYTATNHKIISLRDGALELVKSGVTTIDEMIKVAYTE